MINFTDIIEQCAVSIAPQILSAIVKVESSFNPFAIGVVNGSLSRQPENLDEAIVTANMLYREGWNFSLGFGQVNLHNLDRYGLSFETVFEPCNNLRASAEIFKECHSRAQSRYSLKADALNAAFSCYYSGNFNRGFKAEYWDGMSYVQRINKAYSQSVKENANPIRIIPNINRNNSIKKSKGEDASPQSQKKLIDGASHNKYNIKELRGVE